MCEPKKKKQPEVVAPQQNPIPEVEEEKKEVEQTGVVEAEPVVTTEEKKEEVKMTNPPAEPSEELEEEPMVQIQESLYISVMPLSNLHY